MGETPPKSPAGYLVVKLGQAHRRQYVSLRSDRAPMLLTHQNVRALDAGKKPLLAVSLADAKINREADVVSIDNPGSELLSLVCTAVCDASAWEEALLAAIAAHRAEDAEDGEDEEQAVELRKSSMDTDYTLDLKALRRLRTESQEMLLKAEANMEEEEKSLVKMLLEAAAKEDDADEVEQLIDSGITDVDCVNPAGRSALHIAAGQGHAAVVSKLL
jgi:hypothetical protein